MKTMAAAKCKAQFLSVLKEVEAKREPILVTRNGKPVAKMVPLEIPETEDPLEVFRFPGKIEIVGDIEAPLYTEKNGKSFLSNLWSK